MANSRRVVVYASFLTFLLLTGCVTVIRPKDQATIRSGSVNAEVGFRSQVCADTFKAVLDGNNVTGQFSQLQGSQVRQATLTNLALGPHTLIASADTLQWWFLIPYCGGNSDAVNFCVAEETSLSTPSKTAFLFQNKGRGLSDSCLTADQNNVLIQRACNNTPDQAWSIRNNTNM